MNSYSILSNTLLLAIVTSLTTAQLTPSYKVCFVTPSIKRTVNQSLKATKTKYSQDVGPESSPFVTKKEADRSEFCAENFGECEFQEIEELRSKLHTERITNFVDETSGVASLLDIKDELDHMILEEELTLQLQLLKNEINSVSPAVPAFDNEATKLPSIPSDTNGSTSIIASGLPEAMAICVAIVLITIAPRLVQI